MSKSKTMWQDTSKAGGATTLTDAELKAVSGGMDLKGASEALTQRTQQNAVNAQIMQQMAGGR